jgi:hypothetical protein
MSQDEKNMQPNEYSNPGTSEYHMAALPTERSGRLHISSSYKCTVLYHDNNKRKTILEVMSTCCVISNLLMHTCNESL